MSCCGSVMGRDRYHYMDYPIKKLGYVHSNDDPSMTCQRNEKYATHQGPCCDIDSQYVNRPKVHGRIGYAPQNHGPSGLFTWVGNTRCTNQYSVLVPQAFGGNGVNGVASCGNGYRVNVCGALNTGYSVYGNYSTNWENQHGRRYNSCGC